MIIAPSLLAARFGRLEREIERCDRAKADWLHLDIMDGHFVPNISFGPAVVQLARGLTKRFLDVHLMCSRPRILIDPFVKAGANQLTVHVELEEGVMPLLWQIRSKGVKVGLALNPSTSMSAVKPILKQLDTLLVMTVHPGFGGQAFIEEVLPKIRQAAIWRKEGGFGYRIEVDGGIDFERAAECAGMGADTFVSGTGLFKKTNLRAAIAKMRETVREAARQAPRGAGKAGRGRGGKIKGKEQR